MISTLVFIALSFNHETALADNVHLGLRIHYKTAMSHIEKKDKHVIATLKKLAERAPHTKFLIAGHTDIVGSYDVNIELSKARAETVRTLMIQSGVDGDRIESKWYSYDAPVASNDTEEGRAQNRRIVATVYGLTATQAKNLASSVGRSKYFYLIRIESEAVETYVEQTLEPKLPPREDISDIVEDEVLEEKITDEDSALITTEVESPAVNHTKRKPMNTRFFIGTGITDNRLTASRNNFEAIWVTEFNATVSAGYQIEIKKNSWLGASFMYYLQDYKTTDHPLYTWDKVSPNLFKASLSFDHETENAWTFGVDVNYSEETFIQTTGLVVTLDTVNFYGITGRSSYKFQENTKFRSRLSAEVEYPFLSRENDLDSKGALGFRIGTDVTFKTLLNSHEINLGLFYAIRNFSNIQNDQVENTAGFELKFRNKKWK